MSVKRAKFSSASFPPNIDLLGDVLPPALPNTPAGDPDSSRVPTLQSLCIRTMFTTPIALRWAGYFICPDNRINVNFHQAILELTMLEYSYIATTHFCLTQISGQTPLAPGETFRSRAWPEVYTVKSLQLDAEALFQTPDLETGTCCIRIDFEERPDMWLEIQYDPKASVGSLLNVKGRLSSAAAFQYRPAALLLAHEESVVIHIAPLNGYVTFTRQSHALWLEAYARLEKYYASTESVSE